MNSVRFFPHWAPGDPRQVTGFLHMVNDIVGVLPTVDLWVEVGSYMGESAALVLGFPQVQAIHLVEQSPIYAKALSQRFASDHRRTVLEMRSVAASQHYGDRSVDVVYIDADHRYESVRADIEAWLPKVRRGGFLCGHDYHGGLPGVMRAVDELFQNTTPLVSGRKTFHDSSWLARVE